jgi:hypothetical protein
MTRRGERDGYVLIDRDPIVPIVRFGRHRRIRPDRIEQDVEAGSLQKKARVPDIGDTATGAVDPGRRAVGIGSRRPSRPLRLGAAPVAIDEPAVQLPAAPWWDAVRIEKALAAEVIGDRTGVIAGHLPRIIPFTAVLARA